MKGKIKYNPPIISSENHDKLISPEEQYTHWSIDFFGMDLYYFKIDGEKTDENIYGESDNKIFLPPITTKCLIYRDDEQFDVKDFGTTNSSKIEVIWSYEELKQKGIYPELGDILLSKRILYEIDNVNFTNVVPNKFNYGSVNFDHKLDEELLMVEVKAHQTQYNLTNLKQYLYQIPKDEYWNEKTW